MAKFIYKKKLVGNIEKNIPFLSGFGQAAWSFISSIYKAEWNYLNADDYNKIF